MLDVVALGELLIDFTHLSTDSAGYPVLAAHPGGAPCNLLAELAKLGANTAFLGKVGNDRFGQLLYGTLAELGISTEGLILDDNFFTTLAFVTLGKDGERAFSFARKPGADTQLHFDELNLSLIAQSRIFHFGSLSLTHDPIRTTTYQAVQYAKSMRKLISYDPNLRLPLWKSPDEAKEQILWGLSQADIIKISDEEVYFLFHLRPESGAEYITKHFGAKLVFVTCGSNGCYFCNSTAAGYVPTPKGLHTIDTTGAGDIFGGAALWKLLKFKKAPGALSEYDLYEISRFACAAATLSTTKTGGIQSTPNYMDIYKLLAEKYS